MNHLVFVERSALWAASLLVLVGLIYFLRMPRTRLAISSILHLKHLQIDTSRKRREMRTLLAVILQVVILLLLVLSAARPLLTSGRITEERIILVMDTSASMRVIEESGKTRFEEAKARARDIVRTMEHGDKMLIIAADSQARILRQFEQDRRALYETINSLEAGFQPTAITEALALAREIIRPLANAKVYLISDGATRFAPDKFKDILGTVTYVPVGQSQHNIGLVAFSSRRNMDSDRDFTALVRVQNTFPEPRQVMLKLSIGETLIDAAEITLPPNETFSKVVEKTFLVGGPLKAEVILKDKGRKDPFLLDNVAYDWIPQKARIKVLLVCQKEDHGGYTDAAMSANLGVVGYRIAPNEYQRDFGVDVMIFYNWLPAELPDCHVIFINTRGSNPAAATGDAIISRPLVQTWDRTHPLMNYIGLENLFLAETMSVKGAEAMDTVAATTHAPIILAGRSGVHKVVFIAFDPKNTDVPFRVAFPVLISNALLWFEQDDRTGPKPQVQPGESYQIAIPERFKETRELEITDPIRQAAKVPVLDDIATYAQTYLCGIYTYKLGFETYGFAVNLADAEESDIAPRREFKEAFKDATVTAQQIPVVERELWTLLNWIALILLCGEAWLYHRRIVF